MAPSSGQECVSRNFVRKSRKAAGPAILSGPESQQAPIRAGVANACARGSDACTPTEPADVVSAGLSASGVKLHVS